MRKKQDEALMDFINFISASLLSGVDELNRDLSPSVSPLISRVEIPIESHGSGCQSA